MHTEPYLSRTELFIMAHTARVAVALALGLSVLAVGVWLFIATAVLLILSPAFLVTTSAIVAGLCGIVALAFYWEHK